MNKNIYCTFSNCLKNQQTQSLSTATVVVAFPAFVAKLVLASAGHMITSLWPFNPKFTTWTLLPVTLVHVVHEFSVFLWHVPYLPILFASHPVVIFKSAFCTVCFVTRHTLVFFYFWIKLKDCWASRCWTPIYCTAIFFHEHLERKFKILCFYFGLYKLLNVI